MRNAEGGQSFGNRMEIRPLTEDAFGRYVFPRLRPGFARGLAEYQSKLSTQTHYSVIWRDGDEDWQFTGIGLLDELAAEAKESGWAIETDDFDSPEAVRFGKTADSDNV